MIGLRAASDADIKPVVSTVGAASGAGGFAVAVTGDHTVGNDFAALSSSDLRRGEVDFGLPISIVNMMTGMGLALGIDYSLFVISRFREERARGLDKGAAIAMTAATASRAVLSAARPS